MEFKKVTAINRFGAASLLTTFGSKTKSRLAQFARTT